MPEASAPSSSATSSPASTSSPRIGVIGLAVMGQNLARNIATKGFPVAVYNRTYARTEELISQFSSEGAFSPAKTLPDFVAAIDRKSVV